MSIVDDIEASYNGQDNSDIVVDYRDFYYLTSRVRELESLLKEIAYYSTSCNNCGDCTVCGGGTNDIEFRIKEVLDT